MADFGGGGTGAGLARGIRSVKERRFKEKEFKQEQQQAAAKQLAEAIKDSETQTLERSKMILEEIGKAIQGGANAEEQLEPFAQAFKANLDTHAAFLEEIRVSGEATGADMSALTRGQQFIDQNLPVLEATLQAAEFQNKDFETLSPEELAAANLPEDSLAQKGPDGKITLTFDPTENPSALEERVALLKTIPGLDDETIAAIAGGLRAIGINPVTNERFVMDLATGEEIGVKEPIDTSEADVPSLIPSDIETDVATGVPGALKNAANIITDAVGAGVNFPKEQEATEALNSVQVLTTITLQEEVPGRPSKFLLEKLEGLTVKPNSLFQGEERAKTRLEQTRRLLDGEIQRMEKQVLPLELDPKTKVETQLNLTQMKRLRDAYDDLLKGFDTEEVDPQLEADIEEFGAEEGEEEKE